MPSDDTTTTTTLQTDLRRLGLNYTAAIRSDQNGSGNRWQDIIGWQRGWQKPNRRRPEW